MYERQGMGVGALVGLGVLITVGSDVDVNVAVGRTGVSVGGNMVMGSGWADVQAVMRMINSRIIFFIIPSYGNWGSLSLVHQLTVLPQ